MINITHLKENSKVIDVKDIEKLNVVQGNELITSIAKMDTVPLKIFELCVASIDTVRPPEDNCVYISKNTIYSMFDSNDKNRNVRFKDAVTKLQQQSHFLVEIDKETFKYKSIVPIPTVEWGESNDLVKVEFHREIMPYLIGMKDKFTQYKLTDIAKLNSKYSITLFKLLTMNNNMYEAKPFPNNIDKYKNPTYSVEELKRLTDTTDSYKRFYDFEKRVIRESVMEINAKTDLQITYTKNKHLREVVSIKFEISNKNDKYNKKKPELDIDSYASAINNPYIKYLIEKEILTVSNINDVIGVYEIVVPIYEETANMFVETTHKYKDVVYRHIDHIDHYIDKDKDDKGIVNYLKVCAEDYLEKLVMKRIPTIERKSNYY